ELGAQDGVLATQAGFMNQSEVVRVIFDADEITEEHLSNYAIANKIIPISKTQFQWSERDEDYFIQHSRFKFLPLTVVQKTKINSALGRKENPKQYLSPKQLQWLKKPSKTVYYNKDFFEAWEELATK
ncbi:MAG: hypothetical protein K0U54_13270, partial [Bacteroidetes bacterium]|nr:hypothetical protein [Bacteroidota bacterium]